ncbi:E2 ubiquitin-conjugating protein [Martiniozyma asiatica (nom. inval.)]|nr:E2 ubiquitin-conjugating protein [Martiniozyma asiatica]
MPRKATTAQRRLAKEYSHFVKSPPDRIIAAPVSDSDLLNWNCALQGPEGTPYAHGVYQATLKFPADYPLSPPTMRFITPIFHPNVYADGRVCISILHQPGEDPMHYEAADERWGPLQSVDKVLISVLSLLSDANCESPANVDAAKMMRDNAEQFKQKVRQMALDSLKPRDGSIGL